MDAQGSVIAVRDWARLWAVMEPVALQHTHSFNPHDVTMTLWAAARAGYGSPRLTAALAARFLAHHDTAKKKVRIVILRFGTARQKMVLE